MKLSDFMYLGLQVKNDAEFESACKIGDIPPKGKYLVFIENQYADRATLGQIETVAAIITTKELCDKFEFEPYGIAICDNPKAAFLSICNSFAPKCRNKFTTIGSSCCISSRADISGHEVEIGNNVIIEEYVKVYPGVKIGDNCTIERGTILGCSNYERCRDENGLYIRPNHNGTLIIGNGVIIGEYAMIDKALFDWDCTEISDNCFIGRGSDISHGCKIGKNSVIAHQVSICGNVIIGANVKISVGAVVSNRIKIGDSAIVSIGGVVTKDVPNNSRVTGNLAIPHDKHIAIIKKITSE